MPARSPRQQRAAGADVGRCATGQAPRTFPDCKTARDFARKPPGGYGAAEKKSAKGSPPFTAGELMAGYRRVP